MLIKGKRLIVVGTRRWFYTQFHSYARLVRVRVLQKKIGTPDMLQLVLLDPNCSPMDIT